MNQSRISTVIVLSLLILSQSSTLFLASANGQGGTINLFSSNSATFSLSLTANQLDTTNSIDVPRNVTFQSSQFILNVRDEVDSPGQVFLDIGQDGINEWAFNDSGFGDLGHQNTFINNMSSQSIFSNGSAQSIPFYLPYNSIVESGTMNASYTSDVAAGLIPINNISTYETGDIDNDTRDEIVVKAHVSLQGGFTGQALATLDWTPSTGITLSSWVATCGVGGDVVLADVNGDDHRDVLSIAPLDDRVCFHQSNPITGTLGAALSVSLSDDLITAIAIDISCAGSDQIVRK